MKTKDDGSDDPLTYQIIGAAIEVHRCLGPGLLESAYEVCLCHELAARSLHIERQVPLPVVYKDVGLDCGYRLDLVVENQVIIETKCVDSVLPIHESQLLTYLRLARKKRGLIINFKVALLRDGVTRMVL